MTGRICYIEENRENAPDHDCIHRNIHTNVLTQAYGRQLLMTVAIVTGNGE